MLLINELKVSPIHRGEYRDVQHTLKKLGRRAGEVRDLDVQCDLLTERNRSTWTSDARDLSRRLKKKRAKRAGKLCHLLRHSESKIYSRLDYLCSVIASSVGVSVSPTRLLAVANKWFVCHLHAFDSEADLHTVRKASKSARYMAESAASTAAAIDAAKRYEAIQVAGGRWHDWMDLVGTAVHRLGENHPLTSRFKAHRDGSLQCYKRMLLEGQLALPGEKRRI